MGGRKELIEDLKPMFYYVDVEGEKHADYVNRWNIPLRVAKRHALLRQALAEFGGMLDLQRLQKLLSKSGILVKRQQLESDIEFMKKTSR